MVEPAIITLSCPKCGGQIKGVIATDEDQTIACTYCGTDLHIPKIGGDVIHERVVVVEKTAAATAAPAPAPDRSDTSDLSYVPDVSPTSRLSGLGFVVWLVAIVVLIGGILVLGRNHNKHQAQQDQARELCKKTCAQTCGENVNAYGTVPRRARMHDDDPAIREVIEQANRELDESDEMDCEMTCETKKCDSL